MAGLVPTISGGTVPRLMAGTSPAMTQEGPAKAFIQGGSAGRPVGTRNDTGEWPDAITPETLYITLDTQKN